MRMNDDNAAASGNDILVEKALRYAASNSESFLAELEQFLRIPSVGTDPESVTDTKAAAKWLADSLSSAGLQNVQLISSSGMPLVYGDWLNAGGSKPTILIYGHYDVQPADPIDEWETAPFEPTIIDKYLYCRGASDDKGQLFIHVKSIESYLKGAGQLPMNIKCLFEGEEEAGGEAIEEFIGENPSFVAADAIAISDGTMISKEQPAIVSGIRGNCYAYLDVYGPERDLHSGSLGGVVDNPINALGHIISKLKNEDGLILIPGFYDRVRVLNQVERAALAVNPIDEMEILDEAGSPQIWGEADYTIAERLGARPTLDVHGVIGGFTGEGTKTIIPAHVHAKISMRLVADQEALEIYKLFEDYIHQITPPTVRVEVSFAHSAEPSLLNTDSKASKAAANAYYKVFGREPLHVREGGSIPVVAAFQEHLGIDAVMMGFGLPDDRIHAPNERLYLPNFYRGIETAIYFFDAFGTNPEQNQ